MMPWDNYDLSHVGSTPLHLIWVFLLCVGMILFIAGISVISSRTLKRTGDRGNKQKQQDCAP
jgi:hypothetical protein